MELDNGLALQQVKEKLDFMASLKYTSKVSGDVIGPLLRAHITQAIMLQKNLMAREWQSICFFQREITKIQH